MDQISGGRHLPCRVGRHVSAGSVGDGEPVVEDGHVGADDEPDKASALPRQASLQLAISDGRIVSLPVADRETVLSRDGTLSAAYIRAEGRLAIGSQELTWTEAAPSVRPSAMSTGTGTR